jgi:hypothetical protein
MEFDKRESNYPVRSFKDSPRGASIYRELAWVKCGKSDCKKHFDMLFFEWKDDWESAKSNKVSKNALWISTITIFLKDTERDSPVGTFAVAIGPKGKSHNTVERLLR